MVPKSGIQHSYNPPSGSVLIAQKTGNYYHNKGKVYRVGYNYSEWEYASVSEYDPDGSLFTSASVSSTATLTFSDSSKSTYNFFHYDAPVLGDDQEPTTGTGVAETRIIIPPGFVRVQITSVHNFYAGDNTGLSYSQLGTPDETFTTYYSGLW